VSRASVVMHRRVLKKIRNKQLPIPAIADCLKQLNEGRVRSSGLRMKRLKGIMGYFTSQIRLLTRIRDTSAMVMTGRRG
jgi:hypothetical protein